VIDVLEIFADFEAAPATLSEPAVKATVVIATANTFFFDDI
jgi:hypothetical protein